MKCWVGGTLFGRHLVDANHNTHTLSLMWHIASEGEAPWAAFDDFVHACVPCLRSLSVSLIM